MNEAELNTALQNWNGIPVYEKCVKHCHAKEIQSIVLSENQDGRLLRLFYATQNHELFSNNPNNDLKMCVGFHNHRYSLGLKVIEGQLTNHLAIESPKGKRLNAYGYQSGINAGKIEQPQIKELGKVNVAFENSNQLSQGDFLSLTSTDIHTISADKGKCVAWLIL